MAKSQSKRGKNSLVSQIAKLRSGRYKVVLKSWKQRKNDKAKNTRYKGKVGYKEYLYTKK